MEYLIEANKFETWFLCDEHAQTHPHTEFGEPLPLVNSPRMGCVDKKAPPNLCIDIKLLTNLEYPLSAFVGVMRGSSRCGADRRVHAAGGVLFGSLLTESFGGV